MAEKMKRREEDRGGGGRKWSGGEELAWAAIEASDGPGQQSGKGYGWDMDGIWMASPGRQEVLAKRLDPVRLALKCLARSALRAQSHPNRQSHRAYTGHSCGPLMAKGVYMHLQGSHHDRSLIECAICPLCPLLRMARQSMLVIHLGPLRASLWP